MIYLTCHYSTEPCGFSPNHIASVVPSRDGGAKLQYKGGSNYTFVKESSAEVLGMIEEAKQQKGGPNE